MGDDIFWYGPGSTGDVIWHGRANRILGAPNQTGVAVNGTYTPRTGDLDGDGDDDVFWYGVGSAGDVIWWGQSSFSAFVTPVDGPASVNGYHEPTIGDFDGDSFADLFWFSYG